MSDNENKLYGEILAGLATQSSDGEAASRYLIEAMKAKPELRGLPLKHQFFLLAHELCAQIVGKKKVLEIHREHEDLYYEHIQEDRPWPPSK